MEKNRTSKRRGLYGVQLVHPEGWSQPWRWVPPASRQFPLFFPPLGGRNEAPREGVGLGLAAWGEGGWNLFAPHQSRRRDSTETAERWDSGVSAGRPPPPADSHLPLVPLATLPTPQHFENARRPQSLVKLQMSRIGLLGPIYILINYHS